jgi:CHAT domain-containing protein
LTQRQPIELTTIQNQLDEQTLLLQYALGRRRSYLWVVSRDGVESFVLPPRAEIEAVAQQAGGFIRVRNGESQYWTAAARLSEMILSPLITRLGTKRLVIVPDGALHYVSFSALPLPPQNSAATPRPMIAEHEISYAPSASVLSALQQQRAGGKPGPPKLLVLADPVFSPDDERVRHRTPQPRKRVATKFDLLAGTTRGAAPPDGAREVIELRPLSYSQEEATQIKAMAAANSAAVKYSFQANREAVQHTHRRACQAGVLRGSQNLLRGDDRLAKITNRIPGCAECRCAQSNLSGFDHDGRCGQSRHGFARLHFAVWQRRRSN